MQSILGSIVGLNSLVYILNPYGRMPLHADRFYLFLFQGLYDLTQLVLWYSHSIISDQNFHKIVFHISYYINISAFRFRLQTMNNCIFYQRL